jgi:hypothetical protein
MEKRNRKFPTRTQANFIIDFLLLIMSAVSRILQYFENKKISKYRFYQDTGLSNGSLDKTDNIGSDKCEKILSVYRDLSPD